VFAGLINQAKSAVSGLVLKYVARASVAVPFVIALGFTLVVHSPAWAHEWATYSNERYGFSLLYPADVFQVERSTQAGDGVAFVGMRGHGQLLVGAFENRDGQTVENYQAYIRRKTYAEYAVDYAPRGAGWFVLSGEGNGKVFYEKVLFSCQGRVISSFALLYPIGSKREFDPIVQRMEKSFRSGRDCGRHVRS